MDNLGSEKNPLVRKTPFGFVGQLNRPVDSVAKTKLPCEMNGQIAIGFAVAGLFYFLNDITVIMGMEVTFNGLFQAKALAVHFEIEFGKDRRHGGLFHILPHKNQGCSQENISISPSIKTIRF